MEAVNSTPAAVSRAQPGPEDETDLQMVLLMVMLSVFSLVGSIGNGMVIFVFQRVRDESTAQLFIVFMAVIDLFTCMVIIPLTMFAEFTAYRLQSDPLCKIYHFLITSKVPLSLFIMVAIAVDRYLCICRPLRRIITRAKAKVVIVILFLVACVLGALSVLFHGMYQVYEVLDLEAIDLMVDTNFSSARTRVLKWDILDALHAKNISFPGCSFDDFAPKEAGQKNEMTRKDLCELNSLPKRRRIVNVAVCDRSFVYLGEELFNLYQSAYSFLFPMCLLAVFLLYSLIYRFICKRRARKLRQKLILCSYVNGDGTYENTRLVSTPPEPCASGQPKELVHCQGKTPAETSQPCLVSGGEPLLHPHTSHLAPSKEKSGKENKFVVAKTPIDNPNSPIQDDFGHGSYVTQNSVLLHQLESSQGRSSSCDSLVGECEEKYGHNLITSPPPVKQFSCSPCIVIDNLLTPDFEQSKRYLTIPDHPLEKNHTSQQHVNNNNCKINGSNGVQASGSRSALAFSTNLSEISSYKSNVSSNENSPKSETSGHRRHSHCHAKQKYQWHKKRDSMRRYKGKNSGSKQQQHKGQTDRRQSPLGLDAERLCKENRKANVRTALMLFAVTLMFIVAYTPGWMMSRRIVPYNKLVFFLYFSYNVANPFIYAFMNHLFKSFMRKMLTCRQSAQGHV
ncbi:orexin receptor type 2-like [Plakobranchus ocellatus]|uniref:Orexin receptor type 2-like n=1 Tax=Plakobranchus ocellatus TaxID=259542 RepID=A0AAV4A052_9GAST|nr:orexin receptor type 2-like [Plakobranchus ocellatus]